MNFILHSLDVLRRLDDDVKRKILTSDHYILKITGSRPMIQDFVYNIALFSRWGSWVLPGIDALKLHVWFGK
jgi:hypothetical protein